MSEISIPIQNDLRPAYYDDFHCLAGDCCWNCCKGWRITFNKKDYLSLKHDKYSPELNSKMEHSLKRIRMNSPVEGHYAEIHLNESTACPLQREDGLCALQVEKGAQALPFVCKIFPRTECYSISGYFERSLSLACEAVPALLWDLPDGIYFSSDPLPESQMSTINLKADYPMIPYFQQIRSVFIDYLQDRRFPLPDRILMMGLAIQELMVTEDIPYWLTTAKALPESPNIRQALKINGSTNMMQLFITNNLKLLMRLQSTDPESHAIKNELIGLLKMQASGTGAQMTVNSMPFLVARERAAKFFDGHDYFMENVMVSLFFHLHLPILDSPEGLWKSYVNFCNLYSFYRFMNIFSCREGVSDPKAEFFRLIVMASRALLHNNVQQTRLRDEFFENESTTLAHMAVLLSE